MSTSGIPPPQVIASWPKPNYLNPVTQGPAVTIITIFFGILAVFIYSARLYTRFFVTRAPGVDDLFCGIGLVSCGDRVKLYLLTMFRVLLSPMERLCFMVCFEHTELNGID